MIVAVMLPLTALTSCAEGSSTRQVGLVVADMQLRAEGAECAGTGPLKGYHAGVPYEVLDADRRVVASGSLPPGVAKPALATDFGAAVRIPTVCSMDIPVQDSTGAVPAWLAVSSGSPIPLTGTNDPGRWSATVPEGATAPAGTASAAGTAGAAGRAAGTASATAAPASAGVRGSTPTEGTSGRAGGPPTTIPTQSVTAPRLAGLTTDGGTLSGPQIWGDRPAVLVFFTSWCRICGAEQATLSELADTYRGRVSFVGVSGDDDAGALAAYLSQHPVGYPVIADPDREIWRSYAVREPGFTVVVGTGGALLRGWPGIPTADLETLLTELTGT